MSGINKKITRFHNKEENMTHNKKKKNQLKLNQQ